MSTKELRTIDGRVITVQMPYEPKEHCDHRGYIEQRQETAVCKNCGRVFYDPDDLDSLKA